MIIYELTGTESHPVYKALEAENGNRQYDFLNSIVAASLDMQRPFLSQQVIKALNFHAIACLHINAGEYRPCEVTVGLHQPPSFFRVPALMDDLVNSINRNLDRFNPIELATYVLWRMNNIHPFINGNGRTARACQYFVLCLANGGLLPGSVILPELIKRDRVEYCNHLQHAHDTFGSTGSADLGPLHAMMQKLIAEQLASAQPAPSSSSGSTRQQPVLLPSPQVLGTSINTSGLP